MEKEKVNNSRDLYIGIGSNLSNPILQLNKAIKFLSQLDKLSEKEITIDVLKKHNLVTKNISRVKVMLSGEINRPINLVGIKPTKGAKAAIEAAKGTISE